MKLQSKIQQYQAYAVSRVLRVFSGPPKQMHNADYAHPAIPVIPAIPVLPTH